MIYIFFPLPSLPPSSSSSCGDERARVCVYPLTETALLFFFIFFSGELRCSTDGVWARSSRGSGGFFFLSCLALCRPVSGFSVEKIVWDGEFGGGKGGSGV